MRYRPFRSGDLSLSEIGYGTWGVGGWTGGDRDASIAAMHRAIELGVTFFEPLRVW